MPLRLAVENYRGLVHADWTLEPGVSLLVGPNGSGKTTLLEVAALLSDAVFKGMRTAVDEHGGPGTILNLRVASAEVARIKAVSQDCSWESALRPRGATLDVTNRATNAGRVVVEEEPGGLANMFLSSGLQQWSGGASTPAASSMYAAPPRKLIFVDPSPDVTSPDLKVIAERDPRMLGSLLLELVSFLLHGGYWVRALRLTGSRMSSDLTLDRDGTNAFSVLRNWRDTRATRPKWDFVIQGLKEAFPEAFEDLEFESAGQTVAAKIVVPRITESLGAYFAPDGLLTALLHLTAVASTRDGGAIAIDEFENALHPYAIRALLERIRAWSTEHRISVTLATHSPVLIDQFKKTPERLLVMDPAAEVVPVPVSKMRDPEWLAHFSLGDLYAAGEFGAQAPH